MLERPRCGGVRVAIVEMDFTQDALNCVAYCDLEERVFDSTDYGCEIVAMIFTGDA